MRFLISCFVLFALIKIKVMRTEQKLPKRGRVSDQDLSALSAGDPKKGRGAVSNPEGRFEAQRRENFDDFCIS